MWTARVAQSRRPRMPRLDAGSGHQTRRRAHAAERRLRRPRLRRELRRAGRRARARRQRRARAHHRPLRDRRAPDVRVRRADRVARNLGLGDAIRQTFGELVVHTPARDFRWRAAVDVLDLRLPRALRAAARAARRRARSRPRRSTGARGDTVAHRPRRPARAAVVDALGWRRVLVRRAEPIQPPEARLSRGLEVHPRRRPAHDLELWLDPPTCARATGGASRPATSCASASAPSTRATTSRSRPSPRRATSTCRAVRYQGNWIPHQMRRADRGRRLLRRRQRRPLPADDRRGHPHGALLRPGLRPRAAARRRGPPDARAGARALRRLLRRAPPRPFRWLLRVQQLVGVVNPRGGWPARPAA